MEQKNNKSKKIINIISFVISIIICLLGIVFIGLSTIDKSEIGVKERNGGKVTGLGYPVTYGADFYTEMSLNTKYIAKSTQETYYLIERCFGILLIIIGIFYLLHTLKRLGGNADH